VSTQKPSGWLTYSWKDDKSDVDFIVQEVERLGVNIRLDRWTIIAGRRLWENIGGEIVSPDSKGWLIYATQNSLGSNACREELEYTLGEALHRKGATFPLIAIFPSTVDTSILPPALSTRLCVSLTDSDCFVRIASALKGESLAFIKPSVEPYRFQIHEVHGQYCIEAGPRAGTWSPFYIGSEVSFLDANHFSITTGPRNNVPNTTALFGHLSGEMTLTGAHGSTHQVAYLSANNEITPSQSCYGLFSKRPPWVAFGQLGGPSFLIDLRL
jgi:hypothetical protein